jgi:DNA-binding CsgD family transcriptional regulator
MTGTTALDHGPRIRRSLAALRTATGLPLTFGGPVNKAFQVQLSEFAGENNGAMRGVLLDLGRGLGGKAVALRRPVLVDDYVADARISHHYDRFITAERLRAIVAVPVVVRREVRGVLYGAVRSAEPLGDRVVRTVVEAARDLEQALAVDNDLRQRATWLADQIAGRDRPTEPRWELVRETYAELRILLRQVDDDGLRQSIDEACAKLAVACEPSAPRPSAAQLSPRELDVLACVASGATNAQAAADLGLHTETVKAYLRSAMRKLQCHSRMETVVAARRMGLLP